MQFKLTIKLDGAEVADAGIDSIMPEYLAKIAEACRNGRADAGIVWDGNGANIGQWKITGR